MAFVEGLPLSMGYSIIMVVVDRLSKYVYFMALKYAFIGAKIDGLFLDNLFTLHDMPKSIVSYRGLTFTIYFGENYLSCGLISLSLLSITSK